MSRKSVLDFLDKGADDRNFRVKYDNCFSIAKFVELAGEDGFEFSVDDLNAVLKENGDSFESNGNPLKRVSGYRKPIPP
ncbi:MAG: Nif11-like leader peptide family natural product precursor [Spirochaetales bacterium]|nr:Nif11-like leader peptide family natural product precursor [Spirochaetales bacterium]